jgi:hypothetical protein
MLKLDGVGSLQTRNNWGAALAATSAVFITLLTTGRLKDKWEANRVAAFAVRDLGYEIETTGANPDKILTDLGQIGQNAITRSAACQRRSSRKPETLPTKWAIKSLGRGASTRQASKPVSQRYARQLMIKVGDRRVVPSVQTTNRKSDEAKT